VQSDKASVEITSPYEGTVKEILVQEGQVAKVGEGLCIIEVDEEASNPSDIPMSDNRSPPPPQEQKRDAPKREPGISESGLHPSDRHTVTRRPHPLDPNAPPSLQPSASTLRPEGSSESVTTTGASTTGVLALPAVRHFARENGVDITLLAPGSGKNGRVERVDVERYLAGGKSAAEQPSAVSLSPPAEDDIVVELGRTRYGMWKAMEKVRT
jgi:2-oxoisovalerate dehydrogenase E2 component (dihydrolipoyl transacylase)